MFLTEVPAWTKESADQAAKTEQDVLRQLKAGSIELCRQVDDGESVSPTQVAEYLLDQHQPIVYASWRDPFRAELIRFIEAVSEQNQPDALSFASSDKENR